MSKGNITPDPKTAHPFLVPAQDSKCVRHEDRCQDLAHTRKGFREGRHLWEVTVESEGNGAVGVAKKSVWRKGLVRLRTEGGIWTVGNYGSHDRSSIVPSQLPKFPSEKLRRICMLLDCV
ncbi:hypothetical protein JRQ81_012261 [Phrynocephalus forsythii]|uniref:B30.2/SPRY domain-containing protein n=1 Tax=Phrynocephalus forsythii TaxID=171643 RepID=A0A9Q0X6F4_9SAUR|nr:hypothetical protein JRQ81_012261 [Phrynocephalus forsythii]